MIKVSLEGHALVGLTGSDKIEMSRDGHSNVCLGRVKGSFEGHALLVFPLLGVQTGLKCVM